MSRTPLPVEVCKCIVQFADFDDLISLAVTCRALQEPSESRIYHTLSVVHSVLAYRILTALVETPRLGALVRNFSLYRESGRGSIHSFNDRLLTNDDYWMRVREGLKAMTGLKFLVIVDPTYSHGWVLDPTDVEVEMVQDDDEDDMQGGSRGSMREVMSNDFFEFKLREARLYMSWNQHISLFLEGQDQLKRLSISAMSRSVPHNTYVTFTRPSLPQLNIYDGPITLFENFRGCPLTNVKLLLERIDDEERDDAMLLDTYKVLNGLREFRDLRSLAIVGLPFEGDDRSIDYVARRSSKALAFARRASGYVDTAGLSDEDVDMDREEDSGWEVCVECVRIIIETCPNLEFLANLPLPIGMKGRMALLRALQSAQRLSAIEFDVSHWLPQPVGPYQRMLLIEMKMAVPTINRFFFYGNGERTAWEKSKRLPPVRIPPIKITIPGRAPGTGEWLSSANKDAGANSAPGDDNGTQVGGNDGAGPNVGGAAPASAAKSEVSEHEIEEIDSVGSIDQWKGRYVVSSHPADSFIYRLY